MRRRDLIAALSSAVAAWPLAAPAQQPAMPVVGFLGTESAYLWASRLRAFHQGLGEAPEQLSPKTSIAVQLGEDQLRSFALRDVAIDFNYSTVTEQLMPAFYNDFTAILADITQFARPVTFILKLSNPLSKFEREFGLKQSVATVPDRLFRRKAIQPLGPGVPKFDWPI